MRLVDAHKQIQAVEVDEVPWGVSSLFPGKLRMEVVGPDVTFGGDFVSVETARGSLDYLASQLGGKVKWEK